MKERLKKWPHLPLIEGDQIIDDEVTPEEQKSLTTDYTIKAVNFIKKNKDNTELYIIGDLFESWVGDDHETQLYLEIKNTLIKLASNNIKTYFLYGNRDFLIGDKFLKETNMTLIPDPHIFT